MKAKGIVSILTTAFMAAAMLTGCGGGSASSQSDNTTSATESTVSQPEQPAVDSFNAELTAFDITADMGAGWNLGNTLDATGTGLGSERAWGNPLTTEEMILLVKEGGFNAVRIPTTWEGHMDESYNVDPEWMARVREVVDYAYDNDMYVILNAHHEEWYSPYEDNKEKAAEQLAALWTQIAEEFQGYDEHLVFEGMNEPRWKNTQWEWNGGNEEGREVVNYLNGVFVDAVRKTGGNNDKRFLMVCPYAANCSESALAALQIPDDERVIVSVHAYIPYSFALQQNGSARWLPEKSGCVAEIDKLAEVLDRLFIKNGRAVIIGETGAMSRYITEKTETEGTAEADSKTVVNNEYRALWAEYYFGKFSEIGIPCFWWDNGAFVSGETFGLMDRRNCEWRHPEVVEAIMKGIGK